MTNNASMAKIGILCWEQGQVPKGLMQLETLVGNSTNPASYDYPVRLHPVQGANVHTILEHPDPGVLRTMITDAQTMAAQGVKAITTSCGFNAIFQRQLAGAVSVPVFTSSLLQLPFVQQIHGPMSEICILTANARALRPEHLSSVG
ncbi:MAG: aspartate/glutamate racemase family protein, partial [Polaromonas sp.]